MTPTFTRSKLALTGCVLSIIAIHMAALSGIGHRFGVWHFSTGFTVLKWAAIIALLALALSLAGFYFTRIRKIRRGVLPALLGVFIAVTTITPPLIWLVRAAAVPPIHDITTDTANPPHFEAVQTLRNEGANSVEYGGAEIARQQRLAYPRVAPMTFPETPQQVFDAALSIATELGWHIIAINGAAHRIEATDTTLWFGFKDDVVIRITPDNGGSRVDVRSVSRVGKSDVGTNAERIVTFLDLLRARM